MVYGLKVHLNGQVVLELFDLRLDELDDRTAVGANDVIMMRAIAGNLVNGSSLLIEEGFGYESGIHQGLDIAIHGRRPDAWVHFLDALYDILNAEMSRKAKHRLGDVDSLVAVFQTVGLKVLPEAIPPAVFGIARFERPSARRLFFHSQPNIKEVEQNLKKAKGVRLLLRVKGGGHLLLRRSGLRQGHLGTARIAKMISLRFCRS
jgi:hypothetical protein